MKYRTSAYWPTRVMLASAFLLPVAAALIWCAAPQPIGPPMYEDPMPWAGPALIAVGVALWLVGVVWMLRIFRGPRDEPPPWRYRDR
jgi:hypothetical protein